MCEIKPYYSGFPRVQSNALLWRGGGSSIDLSFNTPLIIVER